MAPVDATTTRSLSVEVINPLVSVSVPLINVVEADFQTIALVAFVKESVTFFIVAVTPEPGKSVPLAPQFKTKVPLFVTVALVAL
jgi:hypothetical protein